MNDRLLRKLRLPSLGLGLGCGLSGSGGISVPALDLRLTAALDSRITFTRASTGTYIDSAGLVASAAVDAPRFDYDPSSLAARGLLVEGARTNVALRSNDFANATWTKASCTITTNAGTNPDGSSTVQTVTATGSPAYLFQASDITTGVTGTNSIWIKRRTGTGIVRLRSSALGTDTPITVTASWTRVTMTCAGANGGNCMVLKIDTSGDAVDIFGAQLEVGNFATSYIPTTTASVTRAADVATITGASFANWYNQAEGTFLVTFDTLMTVLGCGVNPGVYSAFIDGNNSIGAGASAGDGKLTDIVYTGGVSQVGMSSVATLSANTTYKDAFAYKANDFARSLAAATAQTDTAGTLPAPNVLRIGRDDAGVHLHGHISALRYYRTRLPNAALVSLTA